MKKRNLIIAAVSIIALGILLYLSGEISLKNRLAGAEKNSSSERQGHTHGDTQQTAKEQSTEEPPLVEIPLEKQQLMGVKTMTVELKPVQKSVRTVGRIEYDEKKVVTVNTKFEGWIERLYVDYTGRYVHKGEPLAEFYSPELLATQKEFISLLKWSSKEQNRGSYIQEMLAQDAKTILEAARERLRLWDITDEQIKVIEETARPIRTLTINSPVEGYVIQKPALQGMKVMPGDKLFDIADLSTVWVIADIYEYELPLIDIGQEAEISLSYIPGKTFRSKIEFLYPSLSGETRTAKVRFSLSNRDGLLKPQMFTEVTIKRNLGRRLIIPEDAVIDTGTRQIVYVDKGDGYFEPRQVMTGLRADGSVEILKGIKPGERIAISGNFLIDSEAKLKGIVK